MNHTASLNYIPTDIVSVSDYERYAREALAYDVLEYINAGVADDITLDRNRIAFDAMSIYNRVLNNFSHSSTQVELFSGRLKQTLSHPILLAPVAHQTLIHADGEIATAQAAAALNIPMIVSTLASKRLEDIAQHAGPHWFQLYWQPCRDANLELINRAIDSGYSAIVITLDAPVNGLRNRPQRAGFLLPNDININLRDLPQAATKTLNPSDSIILNGFMSDAPNQNDLVCLRQQVKLPLIAKGISHPQDAILLKKLGFDGVVVSNHGGRTLDTLPASIELLPAIRVAVGDDFTVLLDSGIRRGSDIFKAMALGANAVLIGRPQLWALATAGALGVAHMLKLLRDEFEITMALAGCSNIENINAESLFTRQA